MVNVRQTGKHHSPIEWTWVYAKQHTQTLNCRSRVCFGARAQPFPIWFGLVHPCSPWTCSEETAQLQRTCSSLVTIPNFRKAERRKRRQTQSPLASWSSNSGKNGIHKKQPLLSMSWTLNLSCKGKPRKSPKAGGYNFTTYNWHWRPRNDDCVSSFGSVLKTTQP